MARLTDTVILLSTTRKNGPTAPPPPLLSPREYVEFVTQFSQPTKLPPKPLVPFIGDHWRS
jgi:hypothetical protein